MSDRERIDALLDELGKVYADRARLASMVLLGQISAQHYLERECGAVVLPDGWSVEP